MNLKALVCSSFVLAIVSSPVFADWREGSIELSHEFDRSIWVTRLAPPTNSKIEIPPFEATEINSGQSASLKIKNTDEESDTLWVDYLAIGLILEEARAEVETFYLPWKTLTQNSSIVLNWKDLLREPPAI